jgi:hypothetical protein
MIISFLILMANHLGKAVHSDIYDTIKSACQASSGCLNSVPENQYSLSLSKQ